MELTQEEQRIAAEARNYIKKNRKLLINTLASPERYKKDKKYNPTSIFTAGWPGVGKTEYATMIIAHFKGLRGVNVLHLDIDKCRDFLPQYTGRNSYVIHSAAVKAMDLLFDYAQNRSLHYVLDSTFANDVTVNSLERAIERQRSVFIDFIYLAPEVAWINTKARAATEGRYVPKKVFAEAYFRSLQNIKRVEKEFGDHVSINVIVKTNKMHPLSLGLKKFEIDVKNIESYLPSMYTEKELLSRIE